jgi:hypothetical protein
LAQALPGSRKVQRPPYRRISKTRMTARLVLLAALAAPAAAFQLRKANSTAPASYDCYTEKGTGYVGLTDRSASGRTCKNWLKQEKYAPGADGIGNHHYCRNPEGSKEKPWCFTVDPTKDWEFCEVSKCAEEAADPKPWKAPDGSKSEAEEAKGPCEYTKPDKPGFVEKEAGRSCEDSKGDTVWLITGKHFTVADPAGCEKECLMLPGSKQFTFWTGDSSEDRKGNCGCYRTCVLKAKSLTVDGPTVYDLV